MTDTPPPVIPQTVSDDKRDRLKLLLSMSAMAYLAMFTLLLFFKGMPTGESAGVADTLAGGSLMFVKDAFSFVFGSSQGSQDKNATIAASVPPPAPPVTIIPDPTKPGPAAGIVITAK